MAIIFYRIPTAVISKVIDYKSLHLALHQYLTNVQCCYRRFGCETIHPTQNFTSMNLLQKPCVITQAWLILTSEVMEAVRGQKH